MKKPKQVESNDLRSEYKPSDLKGGIRGKYFKEFQRGTNLVVLAPDVAAAFPDSEVVNTALRSLIEIAKQARLTRRSRGTRQKAPRPST